MIKLINYLPYGVTKEEYISKSCIHSMNRDADFTHICMNGGYSLSVKETPEEILAMPDIEEGSKAIDWEQRRYEIAKEISGYVYSNAFIANDDYTPCELIARDAIKYADALINELKKGGEK